MWSKALLCVMLMRFHASMAQDCPIDCDCTAQIMKCTHLTSLPTSVPDGLQEVFIDYSTLATISHLPFQNVTALIMHHCAIKTIDPTAFHAMSRLRMLNLTGNRIEDLTSDMFTNLNNLTDLILRGNKLKNIAAGVFSPLYSLHRIDLSENDGVSFEDDAFDNCPLRHLMLERCGLTEVPVALLSALPVLYYLNMQGNPLGSLTADVFAASGNLQELNLAHCGITDVQQGAFEGLVSLVWLRLSHNAIKELPPMDLQKLRRLDIDHNQLTSLEESGIKWKGMEHVALDQNPWICDCSFAWLKDLDESRADNANLTCASPVEVASQGAYAVLKDLDCEDSSSVSSKLVAGIVVPILIIVAIVLVFCAYRHFTSNRADGKRESGASYRPVYKPTVEATSTGAQPVPDHQPVSEI